MKKKIINEVEGLIETFPTHETELAEGLNRNSHHVLRMAQFYSLSKYLDGNEDALGRERRFYNVSNYRVLVSKVGWDIDIKDINIDSDNPEHGIKSLLLQKETYEWMKAKYFATTLDQFGDSTPRYGSGGFKLYIDEDDDENIANVDMTNIVFDPRSWDGTKIETHEMYPVDFLSNAGEWTLEDLEACVEEAEKEHLKEGNQGTSSMTLRVHEVHGQFPVSHYKEAIDEEPATGDKYKYTVQKYFILDGDEPKVLYAENDAMEQYMFLNWEDVPNCALGRGVIEEVEETQVATNETMTNYADALALASRVVGKTTAKGLANSVLEVDNGKLFELEEGEDLDILNLTPSALGFLDGQIELWKDAADRSTSTHDANVGERAPANTPYSSIALENEIASKPFDLKRAKWGQMLTKIMMEWIIPSRIKKLKKEHILVTDYTEAELRMIMDAFAAYEGNDYAKEMMLKGETPTPEAIEEYKEKLVQEALKSPKTRIKIPEGFFDDVEPKVTITTTGEHRNKAATLQSLSEILGSVTSSYDPNTQSFAVLDDPRLSHIFAQIVEIANPSISPASLIGQPKPKPAPALNTVANEQTPIPANVAGNDPQRVPDVPA